MYELPLFPLNTVLFPGMPLRLHIFEDRYRQMIHDCRQAAEAFGVALIRSGQEVGGAADPHPVGCSAVITQIETLSDGRMNLAVVGHERFQIRSLRSDRPYLVGLVETYPLANPEPERLAQPSRILRGWVERYLDVLSSLSERPEERQPLPAGASKLAFFAASLLQIPLPQKQELLSLERADELVAQLRVLYRREVTLLRAMVAKDEAPAAGPFSPN